MFNNNNKLRLGVDLLSTDILIGRDTGIRPYYIYFELCTGKRVKSWNDLNDTMSMEMIDELKKVYTTVYDVDTFVALSLETKCDSYLGTVGKCLVVKQYERTRDGNLIKFV